jgi:diguanylate cyclase (GGDEF)-like protein/PAS domain S-box-containing protein
MATIAELHALLGRHPDAWVAALGRDMLYVPVPDGLDLGGHRVMQGRWALDHIASHDRKTISAGWRGRGDSDRLSIDVELTSGDRAHVDVFDCFETHGVAVVVIVASDGADLSATLGAAAAPPRARFTRTFRDASGRILEAEDPVAAAELLGWPDSDVTRRGPPLDYVHPDDHELVIENWMRMLADPSSGHRCRVRYVGEDGQITWLELTNYNHLDDPDKPGVVTEMLDISDEMAAHEAVRAREQLLHRLAEALPLGVVQVDPMRRVVYRNDYLARILGDHDAVTVDEQFERAVPEDRPFLYAAIDGALLHGKDDDVTVRVAAPDGDIDRITRVITKALLADSGEITGVIACITDVTEITLQGRELERRATYDTLTGCHNRSSILGRLESATGSRRGGIAVIFVDLDDFKSINDERGHAVGDDVLRAAGDALQASVRDGDVVGRIGGDEFLVLCEDVNDEHEALEVAERMVRRLGRTRPVPIRASVGVAWTRESSLDADHLVAEADAAMYASKREGQGRPPLAPTASG